MKWILSLTLFISFSASAISHKEFVKLPRDKREQIMKAYQDFLTEYSKTIELSSAQKFKLPDFIEAANASGESNCFFAGWPSQRVNNRCSTPSSPSYQRESCSAGQMPCQPMLFGRGLCVPSATSQQKSRAYSSCVNKFHSENRSLASVVEYISDPQIATEADELFRLADEVCTSGAQAATGMCTILKARVAAIREARGIAPAPAIARDQRIAPDPSLVIAAARSADQMTGAVAELNGATRCLTCEAQREQTTDEPIRGPARRAQPEAEVIAAEPGPTSAYPRITSGFDLASCGGGRGDRDGYNERYVFNCQNSAERAPSGWTFTQNPATHPMFQGLRSPYPGSTGGVTRFWEMVSVNQSFNETYMVLEESAGGPDSHNVKSYMFIIPRVTVPSVRVEGENIITTLPTGETVTMNKNSRAIVSGALTEGPPDLSTDRFQRKPPNIHYSGTGISIRLNHRFEHPLTSSETATVKQGGRSCNVPRTALFDAEGKMKTTTDAALVAILNSSCRTPGAPFRIP
ncbi:MAG: hypothetical protein V4598_15725 [Bdellovibrionota bacterium]